MSNLMFAVLEPRKEARVALESVRVEATLDGLLSEVTVTQGYRNLESHNIEAVYTFPLPLDAVLLGLELRLNGRCLTGTVKARAKAEADYEGAVDSGDSAVLLQQSQPGLFTMNLANLMPGESAVIRFRYAQLLCWQGDRLRFHLPTTIAPRYGDPAGAGLAPHEVPETSLTANHGFELTLTVGGALAHAGFECPTHPIAVEDGVDGRVFRLSGGSQLMDRDFVLVLREPADWVGEGLTARDGDRLVCLAAFHPRFADLGGRDERPRCLNLVVDCSGSMAGDSIEQARQALTEILTQLRSRDRFNLIAFGGRVDALFPEPVPADRQHIELARTAVDELDANMGGTEIDRALKAAYGSTAGLDVRPDLLLITDGEVWDQEPIIDRAADSGHRFFTVGVGSAVSEAFVRRLAQRTGGAWELVSPREAMAERIVRHAERIHQPRARSVRVHWPSGPLRQSPAEIDTVYAGDTLHLFAWLTEPPAGQARLELELDDGRVIEQSVAFLPLSAEAEQRADTIARLAAWSRLPGLAADEARDLAVAYQLITEQTSCSLIADREAGERADAPPLLRKVPQVLAAGWGGTGSVAGRGRASAPVIGAPRGTSGLRPAGPVDLVDLDAAEPVCEGAWEPELEGRLDLIMDAVPDDRVQDASQSTDDMPPDFPLVLACSSTGEPQTWIERLVAGLNRRYPDSSATSLDELTIAEAVALGLDGRVAVVLRKRVGTGTTETDLIKAFLVCLVERDAGAGLSRHLRRLIRQAARDLSITEDLRDAINLMLDTWAL